MKLLNVKTIMEKPDSLHNYFAWPTVTTLRDGTLAAVASGFRFDHVCPFGKSVICYSYDGGETWTEPTPIIDTVLDDRDAGILPFSDKDVIMTSFNNTIAFQKSNAGARVGTHYDYMRAYLAHAETRPALEEAAIGSTFKFSRDGGKTWEKTLHHSPVSSPHGPLVTKDGRLIYVGTVYGKSGIECWEIDKADGRMERLGAIPALPCDEYGTLPSEEPHAIELADGRLLAVIRTERQPEHPTWENAYSLFTLYQSISEDGGKTWSTPVPLPLAAGTEHVFERKNFGAPPHLFRHSTGLLILSAASRLAPFGIHIFVSRDEGATWEPHVLTEDVPAYGDFGYPATTELADGSLYTVWYQHIAPPDPAVIRGAHWEF